MTDNVIVINKIIEIKSLQEAWLRLIAAHIGYSLGAIDAGHEDIGIDLIRNIRSFLPNPTEEDQCYEVPDIDLHF